jgi:hypothetical protein
LPLSEKARIEVFLPDVPDVIYPKLQNQLERELTYAMGGCSLIPGLKGLYLSRLGRIVQDRINLLFIDVKLHLPEDRDALELYVDNLQQSIASVLNEEKVLIVVYGVMHSV